MEWQPIETAPKDGTWIIAVIAGFVPEVTHWCCDYGWWTPNDRFIEEEDDETWQPTHWMPLPPPPPT